MNVANANSKANSNLKNILWLIYKPRLFFSQIDGFDKGALVIPFIASFLFAIDQSNLMAVPLIFVFVIIAAYLHAIAYFLLLKISKRKIKILSMFSAILYIDIILILYGVLKLIFPSIVKLSEGGVEYTVLSIAFLFENLETKIPLLFKFMTMVSANSLLGLLLEIIALSTIGSISIKRSSIYCGIIFLISIIIESHI